MSRMSGGDRFSVGRPRNNIYTALAVVGTLVNIIGFVVIFVRFATVFGAKVNLFTSH